MTACAGCDRPMIHGACPECAPTQFLDVLFSIEVSPLHFKTPAHYGAWMRKAPIEVAGNRPRINGRFKAIVFRAGGYRCTHCGTTENLTFGHLAPWKTGGTDHPGNGRVECQSCNQRQWPPLAAHMARQVAA